MRTAAAAKIPPTVFMHDRIHNNDTDQTGSGMSKVLILIRFVFIRGSNPQSEAILNRKRSRLSAATSNPSGTKVQASMLSWLRRIWRVGRWIPAVGKAPVKSKKNAPSFEIAARRLPSAESAADVTGESMARRVTDLSVMGLWES